MSCKYIVLSRENLHPMLCDRPSEGEYCAEHEKNIAPVEELDGELQQVIRENGARTD